MNLHFTTYLQSFRFTRKHWLSLALDVGFIAILYAFAVFFGSFLQKKMNTLGLSSPNDLQNLLQTAQPEQFVAVLQQVKSFLMAYVIGIVLFVLLFILLFSLTRALIWNSFHHKPFSFKKYWRWNILFFALLFLAIIYLAIFIVIKIILVFLMSLITANATALSVAGTIVNFAGLLILVTIIFLTKHHFIARYRVLESIQATLYLLKSHLTSLWPYLLMALITALVPFIITAPFTQTLTFYQNQLAYASVAITFLYLTWLRGYLFLVIPHEH